MGEARASISPSDYEALAEIRYRIRCFLNFSEASARGVGLEPQQHQLLLAVRGLPEGVSPTIGRIAERLQVQHNTAVELVRRCADNGLVIKRASERDRREVLIELTPHGLRLLEKLALAHRKELRSTAPALLGAMSTLLEGRLPAPKTKTKTKTKTRKELPAS
jgi:DNA-binding MarR family transcriptional regulator